MVTSVQVSGDMITDVDKLALFSLNDNNNCSNGLNEIYKILTQLFSEIKIYGTHLELENENWKNKCVLLEAKIQDLSKPCDQCIKYKQDIDNFALRNEYGNKVLFDSDADSRSSPPKNIQLDVDISRIKKSLTVIKSPNHVQPEVSPVKTPSSKRTDRDRDTSPVVQKQLRSGKRTKLSLSSNKKYGFDRNVNKLNADLFSELPDVLIDDNDHPEICVKSEVVKNDTKSELSGCITISDEIVLSDSSIIAPSPTPVIKHRRSKKPNPFLDGKYNAFDCVTDDTTLTPVSVNVLENKPAPSPLFEENIQENSKSKWDLKKQREVGSKNSKFIQTTLGTAFIRKPVHISTLSGYRDSVTSSATLNSVPEDMELTLANNASNNKENPPVRSQNHDDGLTVFYGDRAKKKKSSTLTDLSTKVNEIFFTGSKSNDKNEKMKVERDSSQETIFNDAESIKEKRFLVSEPSTVLQETFFPIDKHNGRTKPDSEETFFAVLPNDRFKNGLKTIEKNPFPPGVNTALQETFFTIPPNNWIENAAKNTEKNPSPSVESSTKIKNSAVLDTAFPESFFNPAITSTENEVELVKKTTPKKIKPKPIEEPKNSFDFLPTPDTPKYKYRRDALRKKADRMKLPGWECDLCAKFYLEDKDKFGETQLNLIRKCSRHRDKYPVRSSTPPGIWNPRFDDTDESD